MNKLIMLLEKQILDELPVMKDLKESNKNSGHLGHASIHSEPTAVPAEKHQTERITNIYLFYLNK